MIVSDLYKVMSETQEIDIYSVKKQIFIFTGECKDITSSCMELQVNSIFTNNDLFVINVD